MVGMVPHTQEAALLIAILDELKAIRELLAKPAVVASVAAPVAAPPRPRRARKEA
jgi:hypothetical protein